MSIDPRSARRWLVLILASGAVLRFVPVWFGLPYRARPDEEVAISIALRVLEGHLNPEFFHWPSLTFYVFAGVFGTARISAGLLGQLDVLQPEHYFLLGRVTVAAAGSATIFVLHRLARQVCGEPIALIAAALLAVAMLHVRDSHFAMTDVLATLLATTSVTLLVRAMGTGVSVPSLPGIAAAGLAAGLAASAKYNAGAVAAAMAAAQVFVWRGSPGGVLDFRTWRPSLVYGTCLALGFLGATPFALLDPARFWTDLQFNFSHLSEGHAVDLGRGWWSHLTRSLPFGLGPTAFAAALWGFVPLTRRHPREMLILSAFVLLLYLSLARGYTVFFRYILPVLPVLCLAAAAGAYDLAERLARAARLTRRTALALMLVVTIAPGLVNSIWFDALLARTDSRVLAGEWLAAQLEPGASVYDSGGDYASLDLHGAPRHHRWHWDEAAATFGHPEGRNPDWLVLHESPVSAYAMTPPGVRALMAHEYVLAHTVRATRGSARSAVYDLQDAFFLPLWGFWTVERPGPTIRIYRHTRPADARAAGL